MQSVEQQRSFAIYGIIERRRRRFLFYLILKFKSIFMILFSSTYVDDVSYLNDLWNKNIVFFSHVYIKLRSNIIFSIDIEYEYLYGEFMCEKWLVSDCSQTNTRIVYREKMEKNKINMQIGKVWTEQIQSI